MSQRYTDPETGRTWITTEDVTLSELTHSQKRAAAEAHILSVRGEISERNKALLDEMYPVPTFEDIGQGIVNPQKSVTLASYNDHAYYLAHKAEFEAAMLDGSLYHD